jgi:thiamine biosynthesis lipoprotein
LDADRLAVRIGREPVDLGGIGKGLAVRWAAELLSGAGRAALVEAGGDLMALGAGPDGDGWLVAVESPVGDADPAAVLRVSDRAVATSSTRVRSWTVDGAEVHHLIDPRTGRSADTDLASVTVVGDDPALSEVWSKALFVTGRGGIRAAADDRGLAALWVDRSGRVGTSRAMRPYVEWQVPRVA